MKDIGEKIILILSIFSTAIAGVWLLVASFGVTFDSFDVVFDIIEPLVALLSALIAILVVISASHNRIHRPKSDMQEEQSVVGVHITDRIKLFSRQPDRIKPFSRQPAGDPGQRRRHLRIKPKAARHIKVSDYLNVRDEIIRYQISEILEEYARGHGIELTQTQFNAMTYSVFQNIGQELNQIGLSEKIQAQINSVEIPVRESPDSYRDFGDFR